MICHIKVVHLLVHNGHANVAVINDDDLEAMSKVKKSTKLPRKFAVIQNSLLKFLPQCRDERRRFSRTIKRWPCCELMDFVD